MQEDNIEQTNAIDGALDTLSVSMSLFQHIQSRMERSSQLTLWEPASTKQSKPTVP